jgi:hypothetical protein
LIVRLLLGDSIRKGSIFVIFAGLLLWPVLSFGNSKYVISGTIRDKRTGEVLIGATIMVSETRNGITTNSYGFYSLSLSEGSYTIRYSFVGYTVIEKEIRLAGNLTVDVELSQTETQLNEVEIKGERKDAGVRAPEMNLIKLDIKTINRIPALLGEIDILKALQLLPGVTATSEGASGFSVRGGGSDQNLIILDEAPVYNASHLLGFISVFNNDVIKDVTLYKGDMPVNYGGRLSSVVDVRMKDGNAKKLSLSGGLGTIASRIAVEGPIKNERTTFIVSGRRSYVDIFLPLSPDEDIHNYRLYFFDLNAKISHRINAANSVYFSSYAGRDVFKNKSVQTDYGNRTFTFRWNHLYSQKLFSNLSLYYTTYNYQMGTPEEESNAFLWKAGMNDLSLKYDVTWYLNMNNTIRIGLQTTYHRFKPGTADGLGENQEFTHFELKPNRSLEHGLYLTNEQKISPAISLKYGLRFSGFQNMGPSTFFRYDTSYAILDSIKYRKGELFHTYFGVEPRISVSCVLSGHSSVKGSYAHTIQYLTLAQNSTSGTPLDVWFPASPNVRPQVAEQFSIGYFHNSRNNSFETSAEFYYKKINRLIDFKDHAQLLLNPYLEGELRFGKGWSYGAEIFLKKNQGRFGGWISYTYSRSWRKVNQINSGDKYPAPYDKPHNFNIVLNYKMSKRIESSLTWVYLTGTPVTFPTGRFIVSGTLIPIYSSRNSYRYPDYHRLDMSVTLKAREKPAKKWQGELTLAVYNAYGRKNTWTITFERRIGTSYELYAEKTYIFSVVPALSYNFKF